MTKFQMPEQVTKLSKEQQDAIFRTLVTVGLLTDTGELTDFSVDKMPDRNKKALTAALDALGLEHGSDLSTMGWNWKCIAARVAEAAAVAACASVPGGQIAVAACIAGAHEIANKVCK
jgi:hypothetical protein